MTEQENAETEEDLGPMPEPEAESPQLHPGGTDAVLDRVEAPLVPDLSAEDNPATEASPTETREGEDTSTKATRSEEDAGDGNHPEESPA
ncbi:hypothetical protein [Nocardioides sp.]|jgi:hypothetical protein|uniref:hypothetical protein n=1 Tax=Nocardioides sp. TaxID=35761 RepID=UPI0026113BBA|nr:hypothetical protein [uncultured Nocardioides sp.]MCK5929235.1 hypothetical protein [Nocardioides sp.]